MIKRGIYIYLILYVIFVVYLIVGADIDWSMGFNDYDPVEDIGSLNIASFDLLDEKYDLRLSDDITLTYDVDRIVQVEDSDYHLKYSIDYEVISEEQAYNEFKDYSERVLDIDDSRDSTIRKLLAFTIILLLVLNLRLLFIR